MKTFNHRRPVRNEAGEVIDTRPAPVWRKTERDELGHNHGSDRGRALAVGLLPGDMIAIRPAGTRRPALEIKPSDLYSFLIRCAANRDTLAKAREKKERKAIRLARQRQERAEKRLTRPLDV